MGVGSGRSCSSNRCSPTSRHSPARRHPTTVRTPGSVFGAPGAVPVALGPPTPTSSTEYNRVAAEGREPPYPMWISDQCPTGREPGARDGDGSKWPSPPWPPVLSPQAQTVPSTASASEPPHNVLTCLMAGSPDTAVGVVKVGPGTPVACPTSLLPMAWTSPAASIQTVVCPNEDKSRDRYCRELGRASAPRRPRCPVHRNRCFPTPMPHRSGCRRTTFESMTLSAVG